MTVDQWCSLAFFICVVYTWGCINRGWTSPADIWADIAKNRGGHRGSDEENAWSEGTDDETEPDGADMSGHPLKEPLGPPQKLHLRNGPRGFDDDILTVDETSKRNHRPSFNEKSVKRQPGESGPAWVRRMLDLDLLTRSEIWSIGSKEFGVTDRTIRRWIRVIEGPDIKIVPDSEAK